MGQSLGCQSRPERPDLRSAAIPAPEEIVKAGESAFASVLPGKVAQGFGDEFSLLVEVLDSLGDNGRRSIHYRHRPSFDARASRLPGGCDPGSEISVSRLIGGSDSEATSSWAGGVSGGAIGIVFTGLVDLHRLAVELRDPQNGRSRPRKSIRVKVEFARILVHTCAPTDDLLELGHRAHLPIEHDQPAGLHVDAGGEQARRGDQIPGISGFRVDEIVELVLSLGIVAGNAHDIAEVVACHEIGVFVDQRLAHACGMFLVNAKDDRLLEPISALPQKLAVTLLRHQFRASVE